jgi:hypothetical protein
MPEPRDQPAVAPEASPPGSGEAGASPQPGPAASLETAPAEVGADPAPFALGQRVSLVQPLRYLKTAEPMPMLRPPDLVDSGEVGLVAEVRGRDQLAVRFRRGTFLIAARDLRPVPLDRPAD